MITNIYSVFDSKAAYFGTPWFMMNDGSALREFGDLVSDKRSRVSAHPEDYSLFLVGSFDDQTGELIPSKPRNMVTASAMVRPVNGMDFPTVVGNGNASNVVVSAEA